MTPEKCQNMSQKTGTSITLSTIPSHCQQFCVNRGALLGRRSRDLGIEETRCLIVDFITHHDTSRWVEYGRGASLTDEGTEDFVDPLVSRIPGTIGPRARDEVATAGL